MQWSYSCPHCQAMLNPGEIIILVARRGPMSMLVGLHPEPGNYEVYLPPGAEVERGSAWEFCCPVCHRSLATGDHEHLCRIDMSTGEEQRQVFFSRVAGDQATFVVGTRGVEQTLGADADQYYPAVATLKYIL